MKKVYFAGSVDNYRRQLFGNNRIMNDSLEWGEIQGCKTYEYPAQTIHGGWVNYIGPNMIGCDHQCWHSQPHGMVSNFFSDSQATDIATTSCPWGDAGLNRTTAVKRCLHQIRLADAVHAYINSTDCIGTLAEIGYANAKGKPIYLVFGPNALPTPKPKCVLPDDIGTDGLIMWTPELWDAVHGSSDGIDYADDACDDFWFIKHLPCVRSVIYGGPTTIDPELLTATRVGAGLLNVQGFATCN